ncbi:hypothetical protein KJ937_00165 [Patescibacteria group bacterium]|nr:hypothetical protein [Patescibacteria group bacterium]
MTTNKEDEMNKHIVPVTFCFLALFLAACGGRSGLFVPDGLDLDPGQGGSGGEELVLALSAQLDSTTPKTKMMISGLDEWQVFTQYVLINESNVPVKIDEVVVGQRHENGDVADFVSLALATDDKVVRFQTSEPLQADEDQNWVLSEEVVPLIIQPGSKLKVKIMAKTAEVMSGNVDTEPWHGVARSGHTPSLEIISMKAVSDDGEVLNANISQHQAPFMVLRMSQPLISKNQITNKLTTGYVPLLAFDVVGDGDPVSFTQFAVKYKKTVGLLIDHILLTEAGVELPHDSYSVIDENGGGVIPNHLTEDTLWFVFQEPFVTSQTKLIFEIIGMASNVEPGQNITFSFARNTEKILPVTGYITTHGLVLGISQQGIVPNPPDPPEPLPGYPAYFLWSDMSSLEYGTHGFESGDWTTDLYVPGLDIMHTLSAE